MLIKENNQYVLYKDRNNKVLRRFLFKAALGLLLILLPLLIAAAFSKE